ncbi:MAG: aminotransferase class V-fold PLP-dependent enzyme [Gemmatimonadota bacterium]|nr:aminotransferase class V-fold PLP-dependent enzyme [Gemmatimonadota bacterium]MDQ8146629.1 aminotransferase class V-fold PLP-dependent enzyme [Gemmatimonadota bacterium]MDQ8148959.1 aminotransferase class V-fold PLP-dependent enzyme [Gemmatimonadota bacterium]MDQ8156035.1 aminotransferase class V-fold PLP-dependent enzyme [Gemmatimonadota bacterium]MDQ8175983.1 aminotransferase class V-fold PLP-dependent enzyme [Gemmatimonadota bacterium]
MSAPIGYDVDALRAREFPWEAAGEAIHLDHASVGPVPQRARDAVAAYETRRAEPHRLGMEDFAPVLDRARALVASLIGAEAAEIALTTNTSWGINLAAYALPLGPGDIVLGSEGEFPANVYPWMAAARARGFTYERLPLAGSGPDVAALLARVERDPRVRAVALSWVSFWSGARIDLDAIGAACRARGIAFAIDVIQGLGPLTLDLRTTPADIVSCGAQKWLCSPWGSGFVYVRRALVEPLEPPAAGWLAQASSGDFGRFLDYDPTWHADARRFEVGTIPYQDIVGMNATLELLHALGPAAVAAHVRGLTRRLLDWAATARDVRVLTPTDDAARAGIVALVTPDVPGDSARLRDAGVTHSVREGALRLSPHFHNTVADVDAAIRAIGR